MVKRVSARVGRGLTLELALAAENRAEVNLENWHKTLQRHPELSTQYAAGKAQFLDYATGRLATGEAADLKWLLERRHPDLFVKPSELPTVQVNTTVQLPEEVLERARELAKSQAVEVKVVTHESKAIEERLD